MSEEDAKGIPDLWTTRMLSGDFASAWRVSDEVLHTRAGKPCWQLPRHQQYVWDGRPLNGKRVLIRCYQGLGDTLQFIRFAPLVRAIAAETIVWAQPALIPLLRTVPGINRLLPLHDGVPELEYEVDVELMELAHVFRTTLDTLPPGPPYLHVPAAHSSREPNRLEIGVVWSAGDWDPRRNVPVSALVSHLAGEGVRIHSLQRGRAADEWQPEWGCSSGNDAPEKTAAVMRALDLVITVDSMTAHLAVPVWTLLRADADWRWMRGRDDSPWYPTMRLFRQEREGDWSRPLRRVAASLHSLQSAPDDTIRCGSAFEERLYGAILPNAERTR